MGIAEAIARTRVARRLLLEERRPSVVRKVHPALPASPARHGLAYDVEAAYGEARPRVRHARACPPPPRKPPFRPRREERRVPDWSFLAYTPATEVSRARSRSLWRGLPAQRG